MHRLGNIVFRLHICQFCKDKLEKYLGLESQLRTVNDLKSRGFGTEAEKKIVV